MTLVIVDDWYRETCRRMSGDKEGMPPCHLPIPLSPCIYILWYPTRPSSKGHSNTIETLREALANLLVWKSEVIHAKFAIILLDGEITALIEYGDRVGNLVGRYVKATLP